MIIVWMIPAGRIVMDSSLVTKVGPNVWQNVVESFYNKSNPELRVLILLLEIDWNRRLVQVDEHESWLDNFFEPDPCSLCRFPNTSKNMSRRSSIKTVLSKQKEFSFLVSKNWGCETNLASSRRIKVDQALNPHDSRTLFRYVLSFSSHIV